MSLNQPPHARDLRKGRWSQHNQIYLLTTTTQKRAPVFENWRVGRLLVTELRHAEESGLVTSLAWVLMPDHLHWLVALKTGTLEKLMRQVKSRSAIAINQPQANRGQLWQRGYHDHALRKEEDVRSVARYIIANPLRANLVTRIGDYPLWDAIWI